MNNKEKHALEILKFILDKPFNGFDKYYFEEKETDESVYMMVYQAIELIINLIDKQDSIIKNAIDFIQYNNKEFKNYSSQEMIDWLYGLDKCCEIKEEN